MSTKESLQEINQKIDQITKLYIEVIVLVEKASWNEAIEDAAKEVERWKDRTSPEDIRKLKK